MPYGTTWKVDVLIDPALIEQSRANLLHRADALNRMRFSNTIQRNIHFKEIRLGFKRGAMSSWIKPFLNQGAKSFAIYRLTVNNQHGADALRRAFASFKRPNGHVFARNIGVPDSTTIYVGSSQNIGVRLQQHLYTCAKRTYALKMNHWCPDADFHVSVEVTLTQGPVEASQVQDVEDALWIRSRPMFGKFGPK